MGPPAAPRLRQVNGDSGRVMQEGSLAALLHFASRTRDFGTKW